MAGSRYILFCGLFFLYCTTSLHVSGKYNYKTFFKFLAKFGFQKTNLKDKSQTQGYIYGNITAQKNSSHLVSLAVLDRGRLWGVISNEKLESS